MTAQELKTNLQTVVDSITRLQAAMPADKCLSLANVVDTVSAPNLAFLFGADAGQTAASLASIKEAAKLLEQNQRDGTLDNVKARLTTLMNHPLEMLVIAKLFS
jgi:hypothetical protein